MGVSSYMRKSKKLLCLGCSYTDNNYRSDLNFLRWPSVLGEELEIEVVNLGEIAVGNEKIFYLLYDYLYEYSDITDVCILWTGWDRQSFFETDSKDMTSSLIMRMMHEYERGLPHGFAYKHFSLKKVVNLNLRMFYMAKQLCKSKGIEYLCGQGISPLQIGKLERFKKEGYNAPYDIFNLSKFSDICKNNQYWQGPIPKILDIIDYENRNEYHISEDDFHPNKFGHRAIANYFLTYYNQGIEGDFIYE